MYRGFKKKMKSDIGAVVSNKGLRDIFLSHSFYRADRETKEKETETNSKSFSREIQISLILVFALVNGLQYH